MLDNDTTSLIAAWRAGESALALASLSALADLLAERGDAQTIREVLVECRKALPGKTPLHRLPTLFAPARRLRSFFVGDFDRLLCERDPDRAAALPQTGKSATLDDLAGFSGEELFGKNGGVPNFAREKLETLRRILGRIGWALRGEQPAPHWGSP